MIKLSEHLSTLIVNKGIPNVAARGTNMASRIDTQVNAVCWLYAQINVRVYDSPRPEFLKQCNL